MGKSDRQKSQKTGGKTTGKATGKATGKEKEEASAVERIEKLNEAAIIRQAQEKIKDGKPLTKRELETIRQADPKYKKRYTSPSEISKAHDVNERTVFRWLKLDGFPVKQDGGWDMQSVDQFVADSKLGQGPTEHKVDGMSLTEANIIKTREQAEIARLDKERAIIDLKKEAGELVYRDVVAGIFDQVVAQVFAVVEALPDALDAAIPEKRPTSKAGYDAARKRTMAAAAKVRDDVAMALQDLK